MSTIPSTESSDVQPADYHLLDQSNLNNDSTRESDIPFDFEEPDSKDYNYDDEYNSEYDDGYDYHDTFHKKDISKDLPDEYDYEDLKFERYDPHFSDEY